MIEAILTLDALASELRKQADYFLDISRTAGDYVVERELSAKASAYRMAAALTDERARHLLREISGWIEPDLESLNDDVVN